MLLSIIITAAITAAIIGIFCVKAVRLDKCRKALKSYVVIPCFEQKQGFELFVKGLYWDEIFVHSGCPRKLILVTGKDKLAALQAKKLEDELRSVRAVDENELTEFIKSEGGV